MTDAGGARCGNHTTSVPGARRLGTAVSGVLTGNAPGVAQAACTARR